MDTKTEATASDTGHGSVKGYKSGCRCAECRGAWSGYYGRRRRLRVPVTQTRARRFDGKSAAPTSVLLSPLAKGILMAAKARTGDSVSEIVERLVREHGPRLAGDGAQDGPEPG